MLISKKRFCKIFYNYTIALLQDNGKALSHRQKVIYQNKIDRLYEKNTIRGLIKNKINELKEKKKCKNNNK